MVRFPVTLSHLTVGQNAHMAQSRDWSTIVGSLPTHCPIPIHSKNFLPRVPVPLSNHHLHPQTSNWAHRKQSRTRVGISYPLEFPLRPSTSTTRVPGYNHLFNSDRSTPKGTFIHQFREFPTNKSCFIPDELNLFVLCLELGVTSEGSEWSKNKFQA